MSAVGQIEKRTQACVVALFRQRLNSDYLGDRTGLDNRNIELTPLRGWLVKQSCRVGTKTCPPYRAAPSNMDAELTTLEARWTRPAPSNRA